MDELIPKPVNIEIIKEILQEMTEWIIQLIIYFLIIILPVYYNYNNYFYLISI